MEILPFLIELHVSIFSFMIIVGKDPLISILGQFVISNFHDFEVLGVEPNVLNGPEIERIWGIRDCSWHLLDIDGLLID